MSEHTENQNQSGHEALGYEPDHPPSSGISVFLVFLGVTLFATFVGVTAFMKVATESQRIGVDEKNRAVMLDLRGNDEERLSTYSVVDKNKGVYSIPVAEAKKLIVQKPELLGSLPRLLPDPKPEGQ